MTTVPNRVFGDEVESIRSFDVATQLSIENKKKITIIPMLKINFSRKREVFLRFLEKTVILSKKHGGFIFRQAVC
jgi:transcription-repair coupling factor (superfamily II helicase)